VTERAVVHTGLRFFLLEHMERSSEDRHFAFENEEGPRTKKTACGKSLESAAMEKYRMAEVDYNELSGVGTLCAKCRSHRVLAEVRKLRAWMGHTE
jgi:hypothetical protein